MLLDMPIQPDYEALLANLRRAGTPGRVHYMELFLDYEIKQAVINRYGIGSGISDDDPYRHLKLEIELQRFLSYDYVRGGIDVHFLCEATEEQIRKRVRETLDICQPGGGYCLGSGNSVVNYMPVDNYLTMMDEGRRYK
jgi:hypothetical protein